MLSTSLILLSSLVLSPALKGEDMSGLKRQYLRWWVRGFLNRIQRQDLHLSSTGRMVGLYRLTSFRHHIL